MAGKLNSMRLLEQYKIPYEVLVYGDADTFHDATEVADLLGLPYFMVFKTLVVQAEGAPKPMLAVIPSDKRLDLKRIAAAAGVKKIRMAAQKDAEAATGLKVGGISALMLTQKNWQVYLDQSATELEHLVMSAGERGSQIRVPTTPFMSLVRARLAELTMDE